MKLSEIIKEIDQETGQISFFAVTDGREFFLANTEEEIKTFLSNSDWRGIDVFVKTSKKGVQYMQLPKSGRVRESLTS